MTQDGERLFRAFLEESTGFQIPEDRWRFLAPRLLDRLAGRGFQGVPAYLNYLRHDPLGRTELEEIFSVLTVRKTSFFRNPASFEALGRDVVPRLARRAGNLPLTIWSAGCSTGEEAYTIAMVLREALGPLRHPSYVLASDIVKEALAVARAGSYPESALAGVPSEYRHHFELKGGRLLVSPEVKKAVEFIEHNLVHDLMPRSALGRWDIIFCRNVFIYFGPEQAQQVLRRFTQVLAPGGALFLGHAEVFTDIEDEYEVVFWGDTFYYKKREDPRVAPVRAEAPPIARRPTAPSPPTVRAPDTSLDETARMRITTDSSGTRRFKVQGDPAPTSSGTRRSFRPTNPSDSAIMRTGPGAGQTPTRAYRRDGPLDDATRSFSRLPAEGQPLPWDLLHKADQRLAAADPEGAARELRAAVSRAGRWAEPRVRLARLYLDRGEAAQAAAQLDTAIEVEPLDPHAHYLRGRAYARGGDHVRAEVSFRRALYLEPDHLDARYALAQSYRALDQRDRACRELRNVARTVESLDATKLALLCRDTPRDRLALRCQGEIRELGGSLLDSGTWQLPRPRGGPGS